MFKNYYQILDLSPDATKEEVRKAYKLFASKFHPDKNGNDSFFNARFLEVQEAYEVLSDDDKRKEYDEQYFQERDNEENKNDFYNEPSVKLVVNKNAVKFGETVEFAWETENISELIIVGHGAYPANGSAIFTPTESTNYVFLFSNHKNTIKKEITINVIKSTTPIYLLLFFIPLLIFILWIYNNNNNNSHQDFIDKYIADSIAEINQYRENAILDSIRAAECLDSIRAAEYYADSEDNSSIQSSSDIAQIINTFITNNDDGAVPWSIYNSNDKIRRYDSNLIDGDILPFKIRFTSILTIDGKPIFKNEIGDDGEWGISLHGARVGAFVLQIETFLIYKDPNEILQYLNQKLYLQELSSQNNDNNSDFSGIYKVKGSYLNCCYSMGATGCGSIVIYVSKDLDDIKNLHL
jgi:hypothetical protein